MVNFTHVEAGTPESHWRDSRRLLDAGAVEVGSGLALLVLAAHPDDETLAAGGLIATVLARGGSAVVVVASDGEGSHPRSPTWTPPDLARARRLELADAMAEFGAVTVRWLGYPDGHLAEHEPAIAADIDRVLADHRADLVAAPWRADAHPDHESVGRVAARVAQERGIGLWEMPIWFWHWATDAESSAPWAMGRRLDLDPPAHTAKRRAMAAHRTQIEPLSDAAGDEAILPPSMAAHFERSYEIFFVTD